MQKDKVPVEMKTFNFLDKEKQNEYWTKLLSLEPFPEMEIGQKPRHGSPVDSAGMSDTETHYISSSLQQ